MVKMEIRVKEKVEILWVVVDYRVSRDRENYYARNGHSIIVVMQRENIFLAGEKTHFRQVHDSEVIVW